MARQSHFFNQFETILKQMLLVLLQDHPFKASRTTFDSLYKDVPTCTIIVRGLPLGPFLDDLDLGGGNPRLFLRREDVVILFKNTFLSMPLSLY